MKKVLYIDIPFMGINDGGANRSKFIWKTLVSQYEVDWLELRRDGIPPGEGQPTEMNNHFILPAEIDRRALRPIMIFRFRSSARKTFQEIISNNSYDIIFIRFLSPSKLALLAEKNCRTIILDIDMLLSRLSRLSWEQKPGFSNRYYLLESWKQEIFEKNFFRKPYLFLFSNSLEKNLVLKKLKWERSDNIQTLPNVVEEKDLCQPENRQRILFFGTLSSAANADALRYISEELYPLLEGELEKRDLYLDVAGKGWHSHFAEYFKGKKRLRFLGEVADIQQEISNSLVVFLPLRIASGTRTRILEVANQSVPVITTSAGAEGLDLGADEIIIEDTSEGMVKELIKLLDNESRRRNLGQKLRLKSRALYLESNVSRTLINLIERFRVKQDA